MRRGGAIPLKILLLTDIHGNLPALEAVLNTPQFLPGITRASGPAPGR